MPDTDERNLKAALKRGWRRKCPNCGQGSMMEGYLSVGQSCQACGQELFHHRADDGPAYLTILIVGHVMAPLLLYVYTHWRPEPLTMLFTFGVGCLALSLYLLPRLKGAIVAFQWARKLHGFG
ncbi:MAG: DUF983 domain-containing protein [Paracoccaceae bacterium]|jgi:uncharacterized protein (DUF983 family)